LNPAHWSYIFPQGSIDRILAEHVIEHWTEDDFRLFLRVVQPFLSEQGFIRIAVPDGFHPDPSYIDYVKPGGSGSGSDDHKVLYNYIAITRILSEEQYNYNLPEYFDEAGQFHCSPWEISDGFVERSADYDSRNKERSLSYTSLIIDVWPRGGKYGL
jgi:predicted SAM-dependent methyltransferase